MDLVQLQVPQWKKANGLLHGFVGRRGGKSTGPYSGLNLSFRVGDDPQAVKDNICDLKKVVGVHDLRIVTMKQVHGDHILDVHGKFLKDAGEADGMAAEESGLFLGVLTADCVPILFFTQGRKLVAVVHAGWRGTLAGVASKMVRHLKKRYGADPESLETALGPAIGACCYEITDEVSGPLVRKWGDLAQHCLRAESGRQFLDLRRLNRLQLQEAGLPAEQIFSLGPCTSCAVDDFFSYRRERGETGRQMSFIGWLG